MISHQIPLQATRSFPPLFLDYINKREELTLFYNRFPEPQAFGQQITEKQQHYSAAARATLHQVLQRQYAGLTLAPAAQQNLDALLQPNTFTVTTGHQLNILTGPLYFIYKIITAINACRQLQHMWPEYRFVPMYWMASEDHDADEIRSVRISGKTYTWNTQQSGAVGRFNTHGLAELLNNIPADTRIFQEAYTRFTRLSHAVRYYINELFGQYGLLVVDGDEAQLKQQFAALMLDDARQHTAHQLVTQTNQRLMALGYKPQVFVRPINLFYLEDGLRARIEQDNQNYYVADTGISFSPEELEDYLHRHPEKFSPNVVLRPLYQECVLPNLAYVGGPAEMAYWLQLKSLFEHHHIPFPVLLPRNFAMLVTQSQQRKWQKTGITAEDLFKSLPELINEVTLRHAPAQIRLNGQKEAIIRQLEQVRENALLIDSTLNKMVAAETRRMLKSLEKIEHKMLRAEKRKQTERINQVTALKEALFPGGALQERTDNYLTFTAGNPDLIFKLVQAFHPFDFRFHICMVND
jgi:bacillithiol biosynthesis cysteine-adding enzyme BshC